MVSAGAGKDVVSRDNTMEYHKAKLESLLERHSDTDNIWKCMVRGTKRNKISEMVCVSLAKKTIGLEWVFKSICQNITESNSRNGLPKVLTEKAQTK